MKDVHKRLLKGSGANSLNLAVKTLEQLLLVPILLSAWSVELYGEWLIITAIPAYLSMSDMGFITAASNELARRGGEGDEAGEHRFFRGYVALFRRWSLLLFLCFALAAHLLPLQSWLGLSLLTQQQVAWVFTLLAGGTLMSQNSMALLGGLRVRRKYHVGLLLRAFTALMRLLLIFVVVRVGGGTPVSAVAVIFGLYTLENLIQMVLLERLNLSAGWNIFHRASEPMARYMGVGLEFMLLPLSQAIVLQGMVVMIGVVLGPVAVAIYAAHRTLTRFTSKLLQMAVAPLRAETGLLQGVEHRKELGGLLTRISSMTFWLSLVTSSILFVCGPSIFRAWTRGEVEFVPMLFILLILSTILEGIWRVASTVRLGSNRHRPLVWGYLSLSLLGISMAYVIGSHAGLTLIALPVVFIDLSMCILSIGVTVPLLGMHYGEYVRNMLRPPLRELAMLGHWMQRKLSK